MWQQEATYRGGRQPPGPPSYAAGPFPSGPYPYGPYPPVPYPNAPYPPGGNFDPYLNAPHPSVSYPHHGPYVQQAPYVDPRYAPRGPSGPSILSRSYGAFAGGRRPGTLRAIAKWLLQLIMIPVNFIFHLTNPTMWLWAAATTSILVMLSTPGNMQASLSLGAGYPPATEPQYLSEVQDSDLSSDESSTPPPPKRTFSQFRATDDVDPGNAGNIIKILADENNMEDQAKRARLAARQKVEAERIEREAAKARELKLKQEKEQHAAERQKQWERNFARSQGLKLSVPKPAKPPAHGGRSGGSSGGEGSMLGKLASVFGITRYDAHNQLDSDLEVLSEMRNATTLAPTVHLRPPPVKPLSPKQRELQVWCSKLPVERGGALAGMERETCRTAGFAVGHPPPPPPVPHSPRSPRPPRPEKGGRLGVAPTPALSPEERKRLELNRKDAEREKSMASAMEKASEKRWERKHGAEAEALVEAQREAAEAMEAIAREAEESLPDAVLEEIDERIANGQAMLDDNWQLDSANSTARRIARQRVEGARARTMADLSKLSMDLDGDRLVRRDKAAGERERKRVRHETLEDAKPKPEERKRHSRPHTAAPWEKLEGGKAPAKAGKGKGKEEEEAEEEQITMPEGWGEAKSVILSQLESLHTELREEGDVDSSIRAAEAASDAMVLLAKTQADLRFAEQTEVDLARAQLKDGLHDLKSRFAETVDDFADIGEWQLGEMMTGYNMTDPERCDLECVKRLMQEGAAKKEERKKAVDLTKTHAPTPPPARKAGRKRAGDQLIRLNDPSKMTDPAALAAAIEKMEQHEVEQKAYKLFQQGQAAAWKEIGLGTFNQKSFGNDLQEKHSAGVPPPKSSGMWKDGKKAAPAPGQAPVGDGLVKSKLQELWEAQERKQEAEAAARKAEAEAQTARQAEEEASSVPTKDEQNAV